MSTHNIPFLNIKTKSALIMPNLQQWDLFQRTQERVRNSRGKRAISVRAIEVLLYLIIFCDGNYVRYLCVNRFGFSHIVSTNTKIRHGSLNFKVAKFEEFCQVWFVRNYVRYLCVNRVGFAHIVPTNPKIRHGSLNFKVAKFEFGWLFWV